MKALNNSTYIIAEAGVNHNGDEALAHKLVDIAADAGADAVKFQTFRPEALVTRFAPTAQYQAENLSDTQISQLDMLKKLTLPDDAYVRLKEHCKRRGIDFISTAFDLESLDFLLRNTSMPYLKIPSGEITNGQLLLASARSGKPVLLSTGMSNLKEIGEALAVLHYGYFHPDGYPANLNLTPQMAAELKGKVTVLHCVSQYPAPIEAANLKAMDAISQAFGLDVGYSDHCLGITVPIAAVARGAKVIEKHFTHDVNAPGPDHKASLSPDDLKLMITSIREAEKALGDGEKLCRECEENTRTVARKSVVAAKPITKGETFTLDNLTCKRPGSGAVVPNSLWELLGKPASRDYTEDEFIAAQEISHEKYSITKPGARAR